MKEVKKNKKDLENNISIGKKEQWIKKTKKKGKHKKAHRKIKKIIIIIFQMNKKKI